MKIKMSIETDDGQVFCTEQEVPEDILRSAYNPVGIIQSKITSEYKRLLAQSVELGNKFYPVPEG